MNKRIKAQISIQMIESPPKLSTWERVLVRFPLGGRLIPIRSEIRVSDESLISHLVDSKLHSPRKTILVFII